MNRPKLLLRSSDPFPLINRNLIQNRTRKAISERAKGYENRESASLYTSLSADAPAVSSMKKTGVVMG